MIGREIRMLLRHYLEQGISKRALARKFGISPDTLYRWIREGLDRDLDERPVQYGPRKPVPTKLDPFKPLIQERLRAFPSPLRRETPRRDPGGGLHWRLHAAQIYVQDVRPRPASEPVERFERPPIRRRSTSRSSSSLGGGSAPPCSWYSANSYRMRHHTELWRSLNSGHEASASSAPRRPPRAKEKKITP